MVSLNRKEKFVAYLLLVLGIIVLLIQIMSFLSSAPATSSVEGDMIRMSKSELLSNFRTFLTIVFCFAGSRLLLLKKNAGWIIGFSILLLFVVLLSALLFSYLRIEQFSYSLVVLIAGIAIMLMGAIFLLLKETRQKFMVSKKSFLLTTAVFILLIVVYFVLQ